MNHANFVCKWLQAVKMSINSAKSWFAVDRVCKFALFMDYIYIKKEHLSLHSSEQSFS